MKGNLLSRALVVLIVHLSFHFQPSFAFLPPTTSTTKTTPSSSTTSKNNPFVQNVFSALSEFAEKLQPMISMIDSKKNNNEIKDDNGDESSNGGSNKPKESPTELLAKLGIKVDLPKVGFVDPEKKIDIFAAAMPFILRLGSGAFCEGYQIGFTKPDESKYVPYNVKLGNQYQLYEKSKYNYKDTTSRQPRGPIVIYEFESCPFCRKVREAVSILSLNVEFRPCPKGSIHRDEIKQTYGRRATFPFMKDPNTGIEMFESDDIIAYLFRAYGLSDDGSVPKSLAPGLSTTITAGLSLLFRFGKGSTVKESNPPKEPLVLWTAEGTPFGKLVREELNELQIVHRQISCPRGSDNRQRMFEETGRFQIPYLEDPNTGVKLFESSTIVEYLQKMYGVRTAAVEYM